jgi:hypothetical protein
MKEHGFDFMQIRMYHFEWYIGKKLGKTILLYFAFHFREEFKVINRINRNESVRCGLMRSILDH